MNSGFGQRQIILVYWHIESILEILSVRNLVGHFLVQTNDESLDFVRLDVCQFELRRIEDYSVLSVDKYFQGK